MATPYVGQIMMFGGSFAPFGYAFCNGQTIAISQNPTLFQLIGTTYGGDGQQTFQLPDLQGRLPVHQGTGLGLSTYVIGSRAGTEQVTLTSQNMPQHTHALNATTTQATATQVANNVIPGAVGSALHFYLTQGTGPAPVLYQMNSAACTTVGSSLPHTNLMPSLCISFVIALQGVFPTQG